MWRDDSVGSGLSAFFDEDCSLRVDVEEPSAQSCARMRLVRDWIDNHDFSEFSHVHMNRRMVMWKQFKLREKLLAYDYAKWRATTELQLRLYLSTLPGATPETEPLTLSTYADAKDKAPNSTKSFNLDSLPSIEDPSLGNPNKDTQLIRTIIVLATIAQRIRLEIPAQMETICNSQVSQAEEDRHWQVDPVEKTVHWKHFLTWLEHPKDKRILQKALKRAKSLRELSLSERILKRGASYIADDMRKAIEEYNELLKENPEAFESGKGKGKHHKSLAKRVDMSDFAPEDPSWPYIVQMGPQDIEAWAAWYFYLPSESFEAESGEASSHPDDDSPSEPEEDKEPTGVDLFHRGLAHAANELNRLGGMLEEAKGRVKKYEKTSRRS